MLDPQKFNQIQQENKSKHEDDLHLESDFNPFASSSNKPASKPIQIDSSVRSQLSSLLNDSQMQAVTQSCMSDSFVSLIHGPPGTGKTQVILGILSV